LRLRGERQFKSSNTSLELIRAGSKINGRPLPGCVPPPTRYTPFKGDTFKGDRQIIGHLKAIFYASCFCTIHKPYERNAIIKMQGILLRSIESKHHVSTTNSLSLRFSTSTLRFSCLSGAYWGVEGGSVKFCDFIPVSTTNSLSLRFSCLCDFIPVSTTNSLSLRFSCP